MFMLLCQHEDGHFAIHLAGRKDAAKDRTEKFDILRSSLSAAEERYNYSYDDPSSILYQGIINY
jgi:hypothetical protein